MSALVIPDLNLLELSMWLADLKGGPVVVAQRLIATISSVREGKLELVGGR